MIKFNALLYSLLFLLYLGLIYFGMFSMSQTDPMINQTIRNIFVVAINCLMLSSIFSLNTKFILSKRNILISLWISTMIIVLCLTSGKRLLFDVNATILWPLTWIYSFKIVRKGITSVKKSAFRYSLLLLYSIALFAFRIKNVSLNISIEWNNYIYYVLLLVPWLFCLEQKLYKNILFGIVVFCSIISLKRTAMLAILFVFIGYIISMLLNKKHKLKYLSTSLIFVFCTWLLIDQFTSDSTKDAVLFRIERLSTDEGSGRNSIYYSVYESQKKSNFLEWTIGHGHNTVISNSATKYIYGEDTSAHNDFLEILYDYGIIMFIIFVVFCLCLIMKCISLMKYHYTFSSAYFFGLIIFFIMITVSHLILYSSYIVFIIALFAMIEAETIKFKNRENYNDKTKKSFYK